MGYRKKPKLIHLHVDDDDGDVLNVTLRGQSLGQFMEIMGLGEVDENALADQITRFAESLVAWDLEEEDGTPVPATSEAVFQQDQALMLKSATKWIEALQGAVDAPLQQSSPDGEPSPVASIPMEPLSAPLPPTAVPA